MSELRRQYKSWLNTRRWRKLRAAAIAASDGMCRDCLAAGRATAATEVHHSRPVLWGRDVTERERLMYDPANLVALCADCHRRRHLELRSHDSEARRRRDRAAEDSVAEDLLGSVPGGHFF